MPDLSSNSKKLLLELARKAIRNYLETGNHLAFQTDSPECNLKRGCFVTLREKGALRGCVGTFDMQFFLYQNLIRMATAAAFQDVRFSPVTRQDLDQIQIEISVLGELQKVQALNEIEIGRHGIYVKLDSRSGTFLPDVAVDQKWSVPEFVTYCAREKAGLDPDECAFAEVYRYEVEKFSEMIFKEPK